MSPLQHDSACARCQTSTPLLSRPRTAPSRRRAPGSTGSRSAASWGATSMPWCCPTRRCRRICSGCRSCRSSGASNMLTARWCWSNRSKSPLSPLPASEPDCYNRRMNSADALETLRRSEHALRERGVRHAARFGSVARGSNHANSDINIMIEIYPDVRMTVFDYVDLKDYIGSLFDGPVDVVNREGLKPYVRPAATADAIYAF